MLSVIAENLQPFDRRGKEVLSFNFEALLDLLAEAKNRGASYLDVNPGRLGKDKEKTVRFVVENIERHSSIPVVIDSADPEVIEIALSCSARKPVINCFSMEEQKLKKILPLAARYGTDIIGLVMTGGSVPVTLDDKLLMAQEMVSEAEKLGIGRNRIILDPVVAPLGWQDGDRAAGANVEFVRTVREVFGDGIRTVAGLSNLTTRSAGCSDADFFQSAYLAMLAGAGMDMIMLDIFNDRLMRTVRLIESLEGKRVFSFVEFGS